MAHEISSEVTKDSNGTYQYVTWEWNNGWNLINCRRATKEEIKIHLGQKSTDETSHYR